MRIPQKRSRTGPDWHRGTWQPFESVRQACEQSAGWMKKREMAPTIKVKMTGDLRLPMGACFHPVIDPMEPIYQALQKEVEKRVRQSLGSSRKTLTIDPLVDPEVMDDDLSASVRRSLRGRNLEADLFPEVQEVLVELRFLRDLNDNLKALVVEMRAHAEETKARLERMESEHEVPIKAG